MVPENQVIRKFRHLDHSLILKEVDVNLENWRHYRLRNGEVYRSI